VHHARFIVQAPWHQKFVRINDECSTIRDTSEAEIQDGQASLHGDMDLDLGVSSSSPDPAIPSVPGTVGQRAQARLLVDGSLATMQADTVPGHIASDVDLRSTQAVRKAFNMRGELCQTCFYIDRPGKGGNTLCRIARRRWS